MSKRKPPGYWTLERCMESALNYETRKAWELGDKSGWHAAQRLGILDQCTQHMTRTKLPDGYWTLDKCKKSASQYSTRNEWKAGDHPAYSAAYRYKWMDECARHMHSPMRPHGYWTLDRCKKSAAKYSYKREWLKAEAAPYSKAYRSGWMDQCCAHMVRKTKSRPKVDCISSAAKFNTRNAWEKAEPNYYHKAHRRGWLEDCCKHMDVILKPNGYWNKDRCLELAFNYRTRTEFRYAQQGAYTWAHKAGILDNCCEHMEHRGTPKVYSDKHIKHLKEGRKYIEKMGDSYIKEKILRGTNIKRGEIPPELIELKREQIKLHRLIKEVTQ